MIVDYVLETAFYENHENELAYFCNYIETTMSEKWGVQFRVIRTESLEDERFLKIFKMKRTKIIYELVESEND